MPKPAIQPRSGWIASNRLLGDSSVLALMLFVMPNLLRLGMARVYSMAPFPAIRILDQHAGVRLWSAVRGRNAQRCVEAQEEQGMPRSGAMKRANALRA